MKIFKPIKIDECIDSLTSMTRAGYTNKEKERMINSLEMQEFYALPDEVFIKIKNALMAVAAIRAFGVTEHLQNYFDDTK